MGVELKWNRPIAKIAEDATGGDKTLLFMANEAVRMMDPYVPATSAEMLADSAQTRVENGKGIAEYSGPYSHYQYTGDAMVGPSGSAWAKPGETKHYNGQRLSYSKEAHPKATAKWNEAMMAEKGKQYVASIQRFVKGGK